MEYKFGDTLGKSFKEMLNKESNNNEVLEVSMVPEKEETVTITDKKKHLIGKNKLLRVFSFWFDGKDENDKFLILEKMLTYKEIFIDFSIDDFMMEFGDCEAYFAFFIPEWVQLDFSEIEDAAELLIDDYYTGSNIYSIEEKMLEKDVKARAFGEELVKNYKEKKELFNKYFDGE